MNVSPTILEAYPEHFIIKIVKGYPLKNIKFFQKRHPHGHLFRDSL